MSTDTYIKRTKASSRHSISTGLNTKMTEELKLHTHTHTLERKSVRRSKWGGRLVVREYKKQISGIDKMAESVPNPG